MKLIVKNLHTIKDYEFHCRFYFFLIEPTLFPIIRIYVFPETIHTIMARKI